MKKNGTTTKAPSDTLNESRLHQSLGYRTPAEVDEEIWAKNPSQEVVGIKANV